MANKTDFSMIWGSNAPDKYEFTPENYMTGWHFVGSVPPSRTMFDSWMRMQDEKSQYLHDIMSDAFGTTSPGGIAIDDTKVPTSDKNNLITLLSNLANVEKGIIGDTSWRDNPAITLAAMSAFVQQLAAGSDVEWSGNTWKNKKLGITGLSKQNGYISLGPNFGGLIIQWGLQTNVTMSGTPITLPLTAKILRGVVSDGGNYNNPCGFDASTGRLYASNTAVAFIVICV
ncbi:hypothetical protein [Megasphaera sp.]|uniref:hypothetical protein n=1 Tax=Megasphaera sp. TaxID=2023260 RepID=UPI003F820E83